MPTINSQDFSAQFAVIGGSGFYCLHEDLEPALRLVETPYADKPVSLYGECAEKANSDIDTQTVPVWFLPRHGKDHSIPPHLINYRANLWALQQAGVKNIIAINAVGGITNDMAPGTLLLPDQILDYTWGREHTFFDGLNSLGNHIDFTWPYDQTLNSVLLETAAQLNIPLLNKGVYACAQGPRLETAAEVIKLRNDGADVVGMTGMPEAALARELGIGYSSIAIVVNWGAGITDSEITMEQIVAVLNEGVIDVRRLILAYLGER